MPFYLEEITSFLLSIHLRRRKVFSQGYFAYAVAGINAVANDRRAQAKYMDELQQDIYGAANILFMLVEDVFCRLRLFI